MVCLAAVYSTECRRLLGLGGFSPQRALRSFSSLQLEISHGVGCSFMAKIFKSNSQIAF